jgi:hypothetical protein
LIAACPAVRRPAIPAGEVSSPPDVFKSGESFGPKGWNLFPDFPFSGTFSDTLAPMSCLGIAPVDGHRRGRFFDAWTPGDVSALKTP